MKSRNMNRNTIDYAHIEFTLYVTFKQIPTEECIGQDIVCCMGAVDVDDVEGVEGKTPKLNLRASLDHADPLPMTRFFEVALQHFQDLRINSSGLRA